MSRPPSNPSPATAPPGSRAEPNLGSARGAPAGARSCRSSDRCLLPPQPRLLRVGPLLVAGNGVEAHPDLVVLGVPHREADLGLLQAIGRAAVARADLLALSADV